VCLPQHGRSFVQAHGPSGVTVSTARSLHLNGHAQQSQQQQQQYRAGGGGGVLPVKHSTLASSTRGGNSLNSTRIDARAGHTLSSSQRSHAQSQQPPQPLPSHALHPNHITDVFPNAISALTKTEEHTYSSAINPANGHSHAHNPYAAPAPQHSQSHKVPLRMPVGPSAPPASNGPTNGQYLEHNGMGDDSLYSAVNATQVAPTAASFSEEGPHPHLSAALSADRVVPLQRENLRLVRSNNALQAHLVAEGERIDAKEKDWAAEMRNIKTKHTELQFLHTQKTRKMANVSASGSVHECCCFLVASLTLIYAHICMRLSICPCFLTVHSKKRRLLSFRLAWSRFCPTVPRT